MLFFCLLLIQVKIYIDGTKKISMDSGEQRREVIYGKSPPKKVNIDDICPPKQTCESCSQLRCGFSNFGGCFDISTIASNINYTGLPQRQCG